MGGSGFALCSQKKKGKQNLFEFLIKICYLSIIDFTI